MGRMKHVLDHDLVPIGMVAILLAFVYAAGTCAERLAPALP